MSTVDRYVTFCGLDCEQRAEDLMARLYALIEEKEPENPFWQKFVEKAKAEGAPDALFMIHSYIFYMRDLLEAHDDVEGQQWLDAIETDCC